MSFSLRSIICWREGPSGASLLPALLLKAGGNEGFFKWPESGLRVCSRGLLIGQLLSKKERIWGGKAPISMAAELLELGWRRREAAQAEWGLG